MDVFNLIPQQIHVWVRDMYPPSDELQYLHNIKRLNEITVETSFEPNSPDDWKVFGDVKVRWQSKDHVPAAAGSRGISARRRKSRIHPRFRSRDDGRRARNSPPIAAPDSMDSRRSVTFDRNLLFVSGKGGVGKTVVSQAIALRLNQLGRRVLWCAFEDPVMPAHEMLEDQARALPLQLRAGPEL